MSSHLQYVDFVRALRCGGVLAFVPEIITERVTTDRRLIGFPVSVCFTHLAPGRANEPEPPIVTACYVYDPESFRIDEERVEMTYRTKPACNYRIRMIFWRKERFFEAWKYRGLDIIGKSSGGTLKQFAIQTALLGLQPDEPFIYYASLSDTHSTGVYVFMPDSARHRESVNEQEELRNAKPITDKIQ